MQSSEIIVISKVELKALLREILSDELGQISTGANDINKISQADRLLSKKEASEFLKVSRPTLTEWERKKILSPIRFNRRVFYKMSDLMKGQSLKF